MKRLIVNADDLGLTPAVNRGIVEAHRHGIVTSATLMANGAAYDDAVSLASAEPRLAIGCHVDLVQLAPMLPPAQVPSLCEDGHFRHGLAALATRSLLGRMDPDQVAS
ncbi:MAG: ChbG/HpnK family deacetylase, partial [Terriglobales bacterium]